MMSDNRGLSGLSVVYVVLYLDHCLYMYGIYLSAAVDLILSCPGPRRQIPKESFFNAFHTRTDYEIDNGINEW